MGFGRSDLCKDRADKALGFGLASGVRNPAVTYMRLDSDDRHLLPVKSELKCTWGLLVKTHILNTGFYGVFFFFFFFFFFFYGFFTGFSKPVFLARGQNTGFYG